MLFNPSFCKVLCKILKHHVISALTMVPHRAKPARTAKPPWGGGKAPLGTASSLLLMGLVKMTATSGTFQ